MVEDYIKRKDVLECIKESRDGIDWGQSEDGDAFLHYSACLYRTIASNECFPSADVAEVRRGEWLPDVYAKDTRTGYEYLTLKCSVCGCGCMSRNNFCHRCGADMRKDGGT